MDNQLKVGIKGIIALDIDGTVSTTELGMTGRVHDFLKDLFVRGWQIVFVTGRSYSYAIKTLRSCRFPYLFAVENGATILQMPEHTIIRKRYLTIQTLVQLEEMCEASGIGLFVYTGVEDEDRCYYIPACFSKKELEYLHFRREHTGENWIPVHSFEEISKNEFSYAKCFAPPEICAQIVRKATERAMVAAVAINDPLRPTHSVALFTHPEVNKGLTLRELRASYGAACPLIAAGDDANDESMIEEADIGIAMETAPETVKSKAQLIAPSAAQEGIIQGLKEALHRMYTWGSSNNNQ